jgi:hypothetical protein
MRTASGLIGFSFLIVGAAGGWFAWSAPDFALVGLIWVVPALYLGMTFLYIAITGSKEPDTAGLWLFLWPW